MVAPIRRGIQERGAFDIRTALFVATFALTLGLVVADFTTWIELDIATIYVLPLMLAGATRSRWLLWIVTAMLTAAAYAGMVTPAYRAGRVDPAVALRH